MIGAAETGDYIGICIAQHCSRGSGSKMAAKENTVSIKIQSSFLCYVN